MWLIAILILNLGPIRTQGEMVINEGVMFAPPANLELVSEHHNIIMKLDLTKALTLVQEMQTELKKAEKLAHGKHALADKFVQELIPLEEALKNQGKMIRDFITAHEDRPNQRPKRESLIGEAVAGLFGLATNEELESLVSEVQDKFEAQAKIINHDLSALSITEKQVEALTKAYHKTAVAVTGLENHVRKTDEVMRNMSRDLVLATVLNFADAGTSRVIAEVNRILTALEQVVISTILSPEILPPSKLKEVLQLMQTNNINLVFPPVDAYLPEYFQSAKVRVRIQNNMAIIVVSIPVKSEQAYDLFETAKFWVPYNDSEWSRRVVGEPRYLAVRKDQKMALALDSLSGCIRTRSGILCDPVTNFLSYDQEFCLLNLLKGIESEELCEFAYQKGSPPSFRKMNGLWIGSVQEKTTVSEVCIGTPPRKFILEPGISSLPVRNRCKYIADSFALPAVGVRGKTNIKLKLMVKPYTLSPLQHLNIPELPEKSIPKMKAYKAERLKFMSLRYKLGKQIIKKQANMNSVLLGMCLLLLVSLLAFIKCRHRCQDGCNRPRVRPRNRRIEVPVGGVNASQIAEEIQNALREVRVEESMRKRTTLHPTNTTSPTFAPRPRSFKPLSFPSTSKEKDIPDYIDMDQLNQTRKQVKDQAHPEHETPQPKPRTSLSEAEGGSKDLTKDRKKLEKVKKADK